MVHQIGELHHEVGFVVLVQVESFPNIAATPKNSTRIPIARPIPQTGEKLAMVFDIEPNPALAEAPIPIPWNIGITRKIMHKASSANNGTTMRPKFLLTTSAIHSFNSFLAKQTKTSSVPLKG